MLAEEMKEDGMANVLHAASSMFLLRQPSYRFVLYFYLL